MKQIVATLVIFAATALAGNIHKPENIRQTKTINLRLTEQQTALVLKGLQELPLKESAEVYFYIQGEAVKQLSQAPVVPRDTAKAKDTTKPKPKK